MRITTDTTTKRGIIVITIKADGRDWETLTLKPVEDICEPMNLHQPTSGYVMETEYGKRLSFILDK